MSVQTDPSDSLRTADPVQHRRRWLLGVAALAVLAGAGVAWRGRAPQPLGTDRDSVHGLWSLQLNTPQGAPLTLASWRGRPLLINFWATWCPPCVEELPLLDGFYRQHADKGWQVLGIAVDQVDAVNRFLDRHPVSFPTAMAGMAGLALSKDLGNLSGGLPFTVVVSPAGEVAHRKMGRVAEADLIAWSNLA